MKRINESEVVETKLSLYIDGEIEYKAINLIFEYGQRLDGCKYAVTSRHSQTVMEELYSEELDRFRPYIFLTEEQFEPIRDYCRNESKHNKRNLRNHELYGFTEAMTETINECIAFLIDDEVDALSAIIERCEDVVYEKKKEMMREAIKTLTEVQRRRLLLHYCDNMTIRAIADKEKAAKTSVHDSINAAKKRIEKYFKTHS